MTGQEGMMYNFRSPILFFLVDSLLMKVTNSKIKVEEHLQVGQNGKRLPLLEEIISKILISRLGTKS
jgi:hypothetical protein